MPTTNFHWDEVDDNVVMETTDNNVITQTYQHSPGRYGELISTRRGTTNWYYHYDGMGSTRKLSGGTQNITDTYIFDGFGNEVFQRGTTTNPYGFKSAVGYYTNAVTNDIYVHSRTYHPATGRWLSKGNLTNYNSRSRYGFEFNSLAREPTGLKEFVIASATLPCINHSCVDVDPGCCNSCSDGSCEFETTMDFFPEGFPSKLCLRQKPGETLPGVQADPFKCTSEINRTKKGDFIEFVVRGDIHCRFTADNFPPEASWPPTYEGLDEACKNIFDGEPRNQCYHFTQGFVLRVILNFHEEISCGCPWGGRVYSTMNASGVYPEDIVRLR